MLPFPTDQDITCSCESDEQTRQDAAMREALADYQLFKCGALVDDDGRKLVVTLLSLGYPLIPVMRLAIGIEAAR